MATQFSLFKTRRFAPMFLTQFLGAFNDNVFKQGLILILTYTAARQLDMSISLLNNLAAMLFILPFFLFSALAGQCADKYEKSRLIRLVKLLEIVIMTLAAIGFLMHWYVLLFVALFLMGTHSTFFGPIKYAYLPQALHQDELVGGNGLFQMGTSLSILTGMMLAGVLASSAQSTFWLSAVILVVAILGYFSARLVPLTPATDASIKLNYNIIQISWQTVRHVLKIPALFYSIIGISWFWFYGATFLTQVPQFAKTLLFGDESVVILMLGLFSVGVAIGSLLCKRLTNNQVSFKIFPYAAAGLTIFAAELFFAIGALPDRTVVETYTITQVLEIPSYWRIFADLFLLGFSGGIYIVPLYAFMQAYSPANSRARVVAANNIINALFMVMSAVMAIILLSQLKVSISTLFLVTAVLNAAVTYFVYVKVTQNSNTLQRHDGE